jgi:hypothetical protein
MICLAGQGLYSDRETSTDRAVTVTCRLHPQTDSFLNQISVDREHFRYSMAYLLIAGGLHVRWIRSRIIHEYVRGLYVRPCWGNTSRCNADGGTGKDIDSPKKVTSGCLP